MDKTVVKSLSQCSFGEHSEVAAVDVKNGKIVRIRPQHYDERYTKEEIGPWKVSNNGQVYEPPLKGLIAPYRLAFKKRVYSPNRIKYPLKRVDWDPKGERNPQFIGGTVYDPVVKEVVIGATCTLMGNGATSSASTDRFGDFWFEGLEADTYDLDIVAGGYSPKHYGGLSTQKDVNLGDIPLSRAAREATS